MISYVRKNTKKCEDTCNFTAVMLNDAWIIQVKSVYHLHGNPFTWKYIYMEIHFGIPDGLNITNGTHFISFSNKV